MKTVFRRWKTAAVAVLVIVAGAVGAAQQAGRDDRAGTTGTLDFVVVSRDGTPVTDLKPEELTLRVNNRERPIRSLQYIRLAGAVAERPSAATAGAGAGAPAASGQTPAPVDVAPPYATNLSTTSDIPRLIVIIVDDESMPIGQEQSLRTALTNFVRSLPETDRVALVTVPHGGLKAGPTTDREALRQAIAGISPINPIEPISCRTKTTLSTLMNTLQMVTRQARVDQPVTVAFLSSALTGMSQAEQAIRPSATAGVGGVSAQAGGCYLRSDDFQRVGEAVAGARAQLYVIHPDYTPQPVMEGIENLRSQTGAPLFHLTSSGEPGLSRMARETSGYYVVTFDTEPEERAGKALQTSLRTSRRDVEVRTRPFVAVGRAANAAAPADTGPVVTTAFEMIRSGKSFRDLPLRATTTASQNPDGTLNVVVVFEPLETGLTVMTSAASLFNAKDVSIAYWPQSSGDEKPISAWPMSVGLIVPPGEYRLRIAAIDSKGRTGLVDDRITAGLETAGPLKLGGLMLGQNMGEGFRPKLQFSKETSAMAYLEVYGGVAGMQMGAVFEVANATNGQAFFRTNGVISPTAEEGKYTVTATLPIWGMKPGDYIVRAVVGAAGQPQGRVLRTLRKVQ
jgi:hypothetical protein